MGSPKSIVQNIEYSLSDTGKAFDSLLHGNIGDAVKTQFGAAAVLGSAGLLTSDGPSATRATEVAAKDAAANNKSLTDQAAEANRLQQIQTRLQEEIALRQKSPGRNQTLLTSNLVPSATNPQTLLTSASKR
jgi:hypothetical protein